MQPLTVPGTLASLQAIGAYVMDAAREAGLDKRRAYALRLAVDEIATNVANYGYRAPAVEAPADATSAVDGLIWLRADIDEDALTITLEDAGPAFDPTRRPPPDPAEADRPLEQRQMGGWGIYLAIQNADKFLYRRVGERNRNVFVMNRAVHGELLVVDDRKENRELLAQQLGRLGYTVTCVQDGEEALAALGERKFDLVLLDVDPPKLDALQVLERMKADNALRGIPVLMLTPDSGLAQAERCVKAGAEDYLSETFSPVVVQARVASNLEKQRVRIAERALKESEKLERDLQIGRRIQLSFLPETLPQPSGWEIAARFEPAREVAGDFYDAFPLTHDRVGLVLGDVCDKGVGAALFMTLFRSLIRAFAQQHYASRLLDSLELPAAATANGLAGRRRGVPTIGTLALKNAVELTNNYIINNHGQTAMFATLFFGVLDPETGMLLYVNAGHEPPIIYRPGAIRARLRPNGPAIGIFPDANYEIQQAQLMAGDTLLIYTDGVTDARDADGEMFMEERMLSLLETPDASASALLARILATLRSHIGGAPQFDDITMLAVSRG